jgi:hypothetical protein
MTIYTILNTLRKHKGSFIKTDGGVIRHKTYTTKAGFMCCPICVVGRDKGFKENDIENRFALQLADKMGIDHIDARLLIRAADNLTPPSHPYRKLLEETCF